jgi:hypothetical protein
MGAYLGSIHYLIQECHIMFPQLPFLLPVVDQESNVKDQICSSVLMSTIIFVRGSLHSSYCALYDGLITRSLDPLF